MKKGAVLSILVAVVLLAVAVIAEAQQPKKIPRIGYLATRSGPGPNDQAFQQGLRELGYVEGQNIVIERRWAGNLDRLPSLAAELVLIKVDIIVTSGSTSTRAAKQATVTIPIVMAQDPDPIGNGFIASLARPEGNITGLSNLNRELSGKRLELLKEIIPRLSRLAVFGTTGLSWQRTRIERQVEAAAGAFGIKLQSFDCLSSNDIETAFRAASRERADAVLVLPGPVFNSHQTKIAELAVKHRLPATYNSPEYVEGGGLMSYGASIPRLISAHCHLRRQNSQRR